jgi:hypothetical protein
MPIQLKKEWTTAIRTAMSFNALKRVVTSRLALQFGQSMRDAMGLEKDGLAKATPQRGQWNMSALYAGFER